MLHVNHWKIFQMGVSVPKMGSMELKLLIDAMKDFNWMELQQEFASQIEDGPENLRPALVYEN